MGFRIKGLMVAIMTSCFKDIIKVALVYPCDPSSPLIGGIESFIRGVIVNAPENIQYYVVGATTDPDLRPVGLWCDCQIDEVTYKFFPLYTVKNRGKRNFILINLSHYSYIPPPFPLPCLFMPWSGKKSNSSCYHWQ